MSTLRARVDALVARLHRWLSAGELEDGAEVTRLMRRGQWIIGLGFIGLGVWAALAPIEGAVVANGIVKVDSYRKTVQHAEGGIVKRIAVRNGAVVTAGEVLIELQDLRTNAGADLLGEQLLNTLATAARLEAEKSGQARISFPPELATHGGEPAAADAMRRAQQLFDARRRNQREALALLEEQQRETATQVVALEAQVTAEKQARDLAAEELQNNERLVAQGYVSKTQMLALRRQLADYEVRLGDHQAELGMARSRLVDTRMRRDSLRNEFTEKAATELGAVQEKLIELRERLRPTTDAADRLVVRAPADGIVVNLQVHTVGGVIAPRDVLMEIVPANAPLMVEARIPLESVSQVRPGQPAHIEFTSFRRRVTPVVAGTVTYVSADMLSDEQGRENYYLVNIVADPQSLRDSGIEALLPGMPAVAFMRTSSRSMLEYLLEPVVDGMRRAFREG